MITPAWSQLTCLSSPLLASIAKCWSCNIAPQSEDKGQLYSDNEIDCAKPVWVGGFVLNSRAACLRCITARGIVSTLRSLSTKELVTVGALQNNLTFLIIIINSHIYVSCNF